MQAGAFALLLTCLSKLDDDDIGAKPPAIPKLGSEDIPAPALDLKFPCTSGTPTAPNHPPRLATLAGPKEVCKKQFLTVLKKLFFVRQKIEKWIKFFARRIGTAVVSSSACVLQGPRAATWKRSVV